MATTTQKLVDTLNALRGRKYPEPGYIMFADIRGDGRNIRSLWTVLESGGVTRSDMNGKTARERCDNLRAAIEQENRNRHGVTLAHDPNRPWFPAT